MKKIRIIALFSILFVLLGLNLQVNAAAKPQKTTITASSTYNSNTIKMKKVSGIKGYKIYRSTDKKNYKLIKTTSSTSYTDKNLTFNKTYYYKVKTYTKSGKKDVLSSYSNTVTAKTKLAKPTTKVTNNKKDNKITTSKVSGATGYKIYRSTDNKKFSLIKTTKNTSYTDKGLTEGKTYYYKVRAYKTVKGKTYYSSYSSTNKITIKKSSKKTVSQTNAIKMAKSYLDILAFSRQGLINQLKYEKFSEADAIYGVDNCGANWNKQAIKMAESYLDILAFSRQGLIDQLIFEGFTEKQAIYGVDAVGL